MDGAGNVLYGTLALCAHIEQHHSRRLHSCFQLRWRIMRDVSLLQYAADNEDSSKNEEYEVESLRCH